MALKWTAILVAAVSATLCVTANVLVNALSDREVPVVINMLAIAAAGIGAVLAVVADLFERMNRRITALTEFLIARLNELDSKTGDRNSGFVEGYLLGQSQDPTVVPIGPRSRGRRMMTGGED
ncbi:MAG TPA: hypothetical protein VFX61_00180 [Micromonosporaceae bacterium]|nr:hypothetical protein [Micromonosporaceae bacterium]